MQNCAQHFALINVRRHFKALPSGQPMAHKLLKRSLQLRIAFVAHRRRETNDGRFADADFFTQFARRHEYGFIIMFNDIFRDFAVTFTQSFAGLVESAHHVLHILHNA